MNIKLRAAIEVVSSVVLGSTLVYVLLTINPALTFGVLAAAFFVYLVYFSYEIRLTQLKYDEILKERLNTEEKK